MSLDQYSDSAEHITSRGQIASLLKRLHDGHALLTVSFPGDNRMYISAVLSVDAEAGCLTLDELNPADGHQRVQVGSQLQIQGNLAGIETRFLVDVQAVEIQQEIYLYRAALPRYMVYRQRREFVRVPVRLTMDAAVQLSADGKLIKGRVADLSAGGLGAAISEGDPMAIGDRYLCSIQIGGDVISAEIEIRFLMAEGGQQRRFGARFRGLSPQDKRRIERMVMQLQRELRRA
jgi:c-di-GMP-binding flagellar brake protein YcgR